MRLNIGGDLFELNGVKKLGRIHRFDFGQAAIPGLYQSEHCHAFAAYIGFSDEVFAGSPAWDAEAIPAARIKGYDITPMATLSRLM